MGPWSPYASRIHFTTRFGTGQRIPTRSGGFTFRGPPTAITERERLGTHLAHLCKPNTMSRFEQIALSTDLSLIFFLMSAQGPDERRCPICSDEHHGNN